MTAPTITTTYSGRSTNWPALVLSVLLSMPVVLLANPSGERWASPALAIPLAIVIVACLASLLTASSMRALAGPRA